MILGSACPGVSGTGIPSAETRAPPAAVPTTFANAHSPSRHEFPVIHLNTRTAVMIFPFV